LNEINYFMSTDVSFGVGIFKKINDYIKLFSSTQPAIIYDQNLVNNEYFNNNLSLLKKEFTKVFTIANEHVGEPTYKYLEELKKEFTKYQPDLIIAVGGGSTLDLGKGIALLLTNNVPALSLKGFPDKTNSPIPLITVPSIFGSGSEISYNAVFIDEDEGRKLGINSKNNFPKKALMDPLLTMTAPIKSVVSSAMDTLVHCIDSFGSKKGTYISRNLSIAGFKKTFKALIHLNLNEPESRIDLAIGSVLGISALMNSGDGPTNGFAYYFGVKNKIPHGLAGAIFLKEVMKYNFNHGFFDYKNLNINYHEQKNIDENRRLFSDLDLLYNKLDIPNLSNYGYVISDIPFLVKEVTSALDGSFKGNPVIFDEKSAKEVMIKLL
jgi:alcohol dehydrogenase